jgi:hypothetical protein
MITAAQRDRLLDVLKNEGADLVGAADQAGVDLEEVRGDPELLGECEWAFQLATSKLRSRLTEKCLRGGAGDISTLARTIDGRGELQRDQFRPIRVEVERGSVDWSMFSDDELAIVETLMSAAQAQDTYEASAHLARARQLMHQAARREAEPLARQMAAETLERAMGDGVSVRVSDEPEEASHGLPLLGGGEQAVIPLRRPPVEGRVIR